MIVCGYVALMDLAADQFYDGWAFEYDLIFSDWWAFAEASGAALAERLDAAGVPANGRVLDATCGIGTQAVPLAKRGFTVTACDISSRSIERARQGAGRREVQVDFRVLDVRGLSLSGLGGFDAVVSYGNSLPHLITDEDLDAALVEMHAALAPGGVIAIAIRDYAALIETTPTGTPGVRVDDQHGERIYGQAWQWAPDRRRVTIHVFLLQHSEGDWKTTMRSTTYRTLTRDDLSAALNRTGFVAIEWHGPDAVDPNQPVVTARRPSD